MSTLSIKDYIYLAQQEDRLPKNITVPLGKLREMQAKYDALEQAAREVMVSAGREKKWNCWQPNSNDERRTAEEDYKKLTNDLLELAALLDSNK